MATPTTQFDYHLPEDQIAQHSVEPRDHSRLLILDRETGEITHHQFFEIVNELRAGDVLVMNNTKVFRARLTARVNGHQIELFLLRPREGAWEVLVRPGKRVQVGDTIDLGDGVTGEVLEKAEVARVRFAVSDDALIAFANQHGEIPIPPYVHEVPDEIDQYQTVYAKETGSVAAPTAGFHFTDSLLAQVHAMGVEIHEVTLHVGIGTFRPVKSEMIEDHVMHAEQVHVSEEVASAIRAAKADGRRVIAVGTTSTRTLEGVAALFDGEVRAFAGDVNLFITPGFDFKVIDGLITNFHLPKSTLLMLVSALAGRASVMAAYEEAVKQGYRFFSFGDAMFIG